MKDLHVSLNLLVIIVSIIEILLRIQIGRPLDSAVRDLIGSLVILNGGWAVIYCFSLARKIRKADPNEYKRIQRKKYPTDEDLRSLFKESD